MPGACQAHKSRKKGACDYCGVCRLCDPLESCQKQGCHINWKRKAKQLGRPFIHNVATTPSKPASSRRATLSRRGRRSSEMRGGKRRCIVAEPDASDVDEDEDDEIISRPVTSQGPLTNRAKLSKVCDILGIEDRSFLTVPNNGYTEGSINSDVRALQRGTWVVKV